MVFFLIIIFEMDTEKMNLFSFGREAGIFCYLHEIRDFILLVKLRVSSNPACNGLWFITGIHNQWINHKS